MVLLEHEPIEIEELPSDEKLKNAIADIAAKFPIGHYHFDCKRNIRGLLEIKTFLGTQPFIVDPPSELIPIIIQAAAQLGYPNAEIIYSDSNITNYDEPNNTARSTKEPPNDPFGRRDPKFQNNDRYKDNRY
jgi:hypothetical protein